LFVGEFGEELWLGDRRRRCRQDPLRLDVAAPLIGEGRRRSERP